MLQPKLVKIEPIEPNKLRLFYETGEVKLFDVAPYIKGYWYEELKDPSYKPYRTAKPIIPNRSKCTLLLFR